LDDDKFSTDEHVCYSGAEESPSENDKEPADEAPTDETKATAEDDVKRELAQLADAVGLQKETETEMVLEKMELEQQMKVESTDDEESRLSKSDSIAVEVTNKSLEQEETEEEAEEHSITTLDLTEATIDSEDPGSPHAVKEITFGGIYNDLGDNDAEDLLNGNQKEKITCGFFGFRLFC
jgi:hypothetical protein